MGLFYYDARDEKVQEIGVSEDTVSADRVEASGSVVVNAEKRTEFAKPPAKGSIPKNKKVLDHLLSMEKEMEEYVRCLRETGGSESETSPPADSELLPNPQASKFILNPAVSQQITQQRGASKSEHPFKMYAPSAVKFRIPKQKFESPSLGSPNVVRHGLPAAFGAQPRLSINGSQLMSPHPPKPTLMGDQPIDFTPQQPDTEMSLIAGAALRDTLSKIRMLIATDALQKPEGRPIPRPFDAPPLKTPGAKKRKGESSSSKPDTRAQRRRDDTEVWEGSAVPANKEAKKVKKTKYRETNGEKRGAKEGRRAEGEDEYDPWLYNCKYCQNFEGEYDAVKTHMHSCRRRR